MSAICPYCHTNGGNMKWCPNCNQIWCGNCAYAGKGHYPKPKASNICPYCGGMKVMAASQKK